MKITSNLELNFSWTCLPYLLSHISKLKHIEKFKLKHWYGVFLWFCAHELLLFFFNKIPCIHFWLEQPDKTWNFYQHFTDIKKTFPEVNAIKMECHVFLLRFNSTKSWHMVHGTWSILWNWSKIVFPNQASRCWPVTLTSLVWAHYGPQALIPQYSYKVSTFRDKNTFLFLCILSMPWRF